MAEVIGTMKVCKIGAGMGVYFKSAWGFKPGDLVQVTVKMVEDGDEEDE